METNFIRRAIDVINIRVMRIQNVSELKGEALAIDYPFRVDGSHLRSGSRGTGTFFYGARRGVELK